MLFHHFTPSLACTVISISIEYAYSLDLLIAAHRLYRLTLRNSTVLFNCSPAAKGNLQLAGIYPNLMYLLQVWVSSPVALLTPLSIR